MINSEANERLDENIDAAMHTAMGLETEINKFMIKQNKKDLSLIEKLMLEQVHVLINTIKEVDEAYFNLIKLSTEENYND